MTQTTNATHTPGPWKVDQYTGEDRAFIITGSTPVGAEQLVADHVQPRDARLIAAAPALLEAAEAALEGTMDDSDCPHFQGTGTCNAGCHSEPSCETNRPRNGWPKEQLRAAIALARGEA